MPEGFNITDKIGAMIANVSGELAGYPLLGSLSNDILAIPEQMKQPMQLAIVGKISSSKSTLVNAILGEAEVVRTGAMEETWNVSWLKHGDSSEPIIVHYKDPDHQPESVERQQWAEWANRKRETGEQLKNTVSYIEVSYPKPILKKINIIDTPGLDSFYGTDSQNTLDFLAQVKPDAIVMIFSKNINEDTLAVIENFRQGVGMGISPINAIGVMSKIDNIWASDPNLDPLAETKRIIGTLMSQETVRKTLFNIFPVSAFVALSANQLIDADIAAFEDLSKMSDEVLTRIIKTEKRFVTDYEDVPVSTEERARLASTYGRYGVWLIVNRLKEKQGSNKADLKDLLIKKSGFHDFVNILNNHFGEQSTLIKVYSLILALSSKIHKFEKKLPANSTEKWVVKRVIREIDDLIRNLTIQFNVVDIAKSYYNGGLNISTEEFEELRRINGEFGFSCIHRTGLDENVSAQEMIGVCMEKIKFWRIQFNTRGRLMPSTEPFIKLMINSYSLLLSDIISAKYKLESSTKFLFGE